MRRTKSHSCMRGILLILITLTSLMLINPWFTFIHPTYARAHSSTFQSAGGTNITYVDPANVTNLTLTPESPLTLRPNFDGTFTDWTGSYVDWAETGSHDGDTSYVSANAAYLYESSTMEDHTSESWNIAKVKVTIYARTNIVSDDKVTPFLYIGGWKYMGAGSTLTNETYTECTSEWAKNPNTGAFWSWSDIDALEVGVSADVGDDFTWDVGLEMRVTQLYVEVTGPRLSVNIEVDYVDDLWLYQYELSFNPDVLQAVWLNPLTPVEVGPFLGSAGGTVLENPGAGWNNTLGKLPITGAYLSQMNPTYCPDGSGVLSTVFFEVVAKGESELRLSEDTGLMDNNGVWVSYGRDHVQDGYFRNVAWGDMPKADFTITPVGTPEPLEGYNTTFTSTTTGGTPPYTYKWYLWKTLKAELFWPIVTSTETVSRNYTTRGTWNVTLTVIDDDDVVGTKTGYVRIKAHDIFFSAVTTNATWGVWPSSYRVNITEIVEVNATAKNEGDYTETFDVSTFWSAFYAGEQQYGIIGTQTVTSLAAGASQNVTFSWDTEGRNLTHPEQIAVHANASAVTYEYDTERTAGKIADNQFIGPVLRVRIHDIAVTEVETNATTVTLGDIVEVTVTVANQGDFNQTSIGVTAYFNETAIDTQTIPLMTNATFGRFPRFTPDNYTITLTFNWNTTGATVGNYTISAETSAVPEEIDTADNIRVNGIVRVTGDNTPPDIGTPLHEPESPDPDVAVTVSVNVTDLESGVREVILSYREEDDLVWTNTTMIKQTGDLYEGTIEGFPADTNVTYRIIAYDYAENVEVDDNTGQYYVYTVIPEFATWLSLFIVLLLTTTIVIFTRRRLTPKNLFSKTSHET